MTVKIFPWWITVFLLLIPNLVKGQDSSYLTLEKALELSSVNNTSVQTAALDEIGRASCRERV